MGVNHRIAVIAQEDAYPFELGIPSRIFGAAHTGYDVRVCTVDNANVCTNAGFAVAPEHDAVAAIAAAETIIIPPVDPRSLSRAHDSRLAELLAQRKADARLVSICTGVFTLASLGLLDGRRVATHWECADLFRSWYPQIELEPDVLFVHDGDVHTSAGAAAGIDLCLDLIRADHGAQVASRAARRCIVSPFREGGQAQFVERAVPDPINSSTSATREWALTQLDTQLTVSDLAAHAHMSDRTFVRRFVEETGMAPRRWLTAQRLERARELLEGSSLSIEEISTAVGYATSTSLRNHLSHQLGLRPAAYRRTFHGEPVSPAARKGSMQ